MIDDVLSALEKMTVMRNNALLRVALKSDQLFDLRKAAEDVLLTWHACPSCPDGYRANFDRAMQTLYDLVFPEVA